MLEGGVCRQDAWLGIVEVYGECADVLREVGAGGEEVDEREVAAVGR